MGYGKSSTFYNIPYMEAGDYLIESEEAKKANMIGNLLYVSTFGTTNAILTDGAYTLTQVSSTNYTLKISTNSSVKIFPTTYATFISVINSCLSYKTGDITIQNITQGNKWYIYNCYNDSLISDASKSLVVSSTTEYTDVTHLLLATIDFTGSSPVLDYTTGKKFYANISTHVLTSTNPHGTTMTQANMNITGDFKISSKKILPYAIVDVNLDGTNDVTIPASQTGINPQFVTIMGGYTLVTVTISNTNVTFSSDSQVSIKAKIEGEPVS